MITMHTFTLNNLENLFEFGANWIKYPNGLIEQWGIATAPNGNDLINLNIPFETMNYQTIVSDSGGGVHSISSSPVSKTQFKAYGKPNGSQTYAKSGFRWFAIGY